MIRRAKEEDIAGVAKLEGIIEGKNAATAEALMQRFRMFPSGFLVAEDEGEIIGYAESCRWNKNPGDFQKFSQISDFPSHHVHDGRNLYLIFLGVDENHRRQGIASSFLKSFIKYSVNNGVERIQLVSKPKLQDFYSKSEFNFKGVSYLPYFLPGMPGIFMQKSIWNGHFK